MLYWATGHPLLDFALALCSGALQHHAAKKKKKNSHLPVGILFLGLDSLSWTFLSSSPLLSPRYPLLAALALRF